jgi:hypothetical protein
MKKVELIEKIVVKKEAEKKKLYNIREDIRDEKNDELTKAIKYFFPDLDEDITLEVSGEYVYFKRKHPDYSYPKEVLNFSLRGESYRDTSKSKIETSFYSTSDNSIFELERMVLIGKVGGVVLDFSDDIIANWNCVVEQFEVPLKRVNKKVWALESELRDHGSEIDNLERANRKTQLLSEGIKFGKAESWRDRVELDVRWNWTVKGIRGVKVTKVTPSGKSYNLTLTTERERYNEKTEKYEEFLDDLNVQNVRADKVEHMVNWSSKYIIS